MAFLITASKFMSFATLIAILILLMSSELGTATQLNVKLGRKVLEDHLPPLNAKEYGYAPGGGGYAPYTRVGGYTPYTRGGGNTPHSRVGGYTPYTRGGGNTPHSRVGGYTPHPVGGGYHP